MNNTNDDKIVLAVIDYGDIFSIYEGELPPHSIGQCYYILTHASNKEKIISLFFERLKAICSTSEVELDEKIDEINVRLNELIIEYI